MLLVLEMLPFCTPASTHGKFQKGLVDWLKGQPLKMKKKTKNKTVRVFCKSGKNSDSTMFTKDKLEGKREKPQGSTEFRCAEKCVAEK